MTYDLSIVLPTFNESANVSPIVDRLEHALTHRADRPGRWL